MNLFDRIAPTEIRHRLLWEALVDVDETRVLGTGPLGERRIVPILGGTFRGGAEMEAFHGTVLPGGADRQLIRRDGAKELDALYEMEVADGTVLTIRNRVIIDETSAGPRYAMSRIEVIAPDGPWAWLSRRLIVGTLQSARPDRAAVIIRGWEMRDT
ncbi:DUF3237 domain-containing protein [Antarctobacter sp.]|uniref:DUF3237 domain-containing protein n=1 Tax=Antarctobacter sp. TaxID=1872577 RepID=UPI003A957074